MKTIRGILSNRCPRCGESAIFSRLVVMCPRCPCCGYTYERQNGYFLGAMVISYFMGAFSAVPTLTIGIMILHASIFSVTAVACLQVLLLTPLLFRFSRLTWIYLDFRADPPGPTESSKPSE